MCGQHQRDERANAPKIELWAFLGRTIHIYHSYSKDIHYMYKASTGPNLFKSVHLMGGNLDIIIRKEDPGVD